ncbi:hypothetical protein [Streptomyces halobius]|uniref:Uncharacterized protein n=1 Tax=Streptomyces halobius TaxID=2879846 RepID=A0ABY4MAM6_9ACTN|nr:hypothetical protein [Streptomyces halobius]UQA94820.1 hypothetical protein K9S39_25820 [Streptomyces halobius]
MGSKKLGNRRRTVVTVVVVVVLIAFFVGWRLLGNVIPFPGGHDTKGDLTAQQRRLSEQIEDLRGDDGLFAASRGTSGKPGLYESAYGLSTLRAISGKAPKLDMKPEAVRAAFADELKRKPLTSRVRLSEVERATGAKIHTADDAHTVRKALRDGGYFQDSGDEPDDISTRLTDTSAALDTLDQFGSEISPAEREKISRWLRGVARDVPARPVQLYHIAHIAKAVGMTPPVDIERQATEWWDNRSGKGQADDERLIEAAYVALLADETHLDLSDRADALRHVLSPRTNTTSDPQVTSLIARAWQILDGDDELAEMARRTRSHQLPGGLLSSVQERHGSLSSSYEVMRLRSVAGLPQKDRTLSTALADMRSTVLAKYDPLLRGAWLLLTQNAGGKVTERDRRTVVAAVKAATPRTVDETNVLQWSRFTEALGLLDEKVPAVTVHTWKADSRERRYARALLINGLERAHQLDRYPGNRPSPDELIHEAEKSLRTGTVRESAEALDAAATLGWVPDPKTADRLIPLLEQRRTCPGADTFYRDSAQDSECGVPGTRAGYRISALLEAAEPNDTPTDGTS